MHFYEDFLGEYDSKLKKSRGVYYTPQPVVDFIVRAVDDILKRDFNLSMGLADCSMIDHEVVNEQYVKAKKGLKEIPKNIRKRMHRVQILDPATGTGTFLAAVIRQIYANMDGQRGAWNNYVEQHLLPRLNGFELMMASYTIAHLKLNMVLRETGYTPQSDQRLRVYLTNSLEEFNAETGTLFSLAISQEANEASRIKRDCPVMVMIGNPPYSGESQNKGEWIMDKMKSYKKEPGGIQPLKERNPKWINNDYVKFIRLAQDYVERNGEGIVAFINPNNFMADPTFRGMRWKLLEVFDKIYTIDLHGSSKKNETCPDGSKDENVFDIMQGVSINILIKTGKKDKGQLGKVYHKDLFGTRKQKYDFLDRSSIVNVGYNELYPIPPMFFFVPKDFAPKDEYNAGFKVNDLFQSFNVGVVTSNDAMLVNHNVIDLKKNVVAINDKFYNEALECKFAYRALDNRWLYYDEKMIERARKDVMKHIFKRDNVAMAVGRQCVDDWRYVFVSDTVTNFNYIATAGRLGAGYIFPLWLYSEDGTIKKQNFNEEIVQKIEESLGETIEPQELFDYIYAVLHSPSYRTKYKEFLKIDFPRIPYPESKEEYHRLADLGGQLRRLHLMQDVPAPQHAKFDNDGSNTVDKLEYKDGCVWINKEQCFADVPELAWNFYIGGYQPAQKWLKDRKGRVLTYDDITHYRQIITILLETDRLMKEIDTPSNNPS